MDRNTKALILFSGGQDSATVLAWALERYGYIETVGFNYGQRHHIEMEARQNIREKISEQFPQWKIRLGTDHILAMETLGDIGGTAMTNNIDIRMQENGLPNTFVPGRNLVFLVFAAALAVRRDITTLVAGMCETDFSGYPDCRENTLLAQMQAIELGMATPMALKTPLMTLTKAQSWALCEQLGGKPLVEIVRRYSHTCYKGVRDELHAWGYGCGECPACQLRANGWHLYSEANAEEH